MLILYEFTSLINIIMADEDNADQGDLSQDSEVLRCQTVWGVAESNAATKVSMIGSRISNIGSVVSIDSYVTELQEIMERHDVEWGR